ncbi:hypothetical protein [Marinobacter sp. NFXS9]|uniref:general secretion pathway protein GspK n=1 Tax=Marinobacter sp. NFXS9 TaxID=2818433 RepID=UPI0032DE59BD
MNRVPPDNQGGFVLAVVLWSVAALTLITGGIVAKINSTLEQASSMRELVRSDQDAMATEQTLLYLLSTHSQNEAGAQLATNIGGLDKDENKSTDPFAGRSSNEVEGPTLRFDGTWYQGIGDVSFSLQDAGATLSLLEPERDTWLRAMSLLGLSADTASQWYDELLDYEDRDSLTRLNGAEKEGYRDQGLAPPPNRFPVTPFEIRNLPIARQNPDVADDLIRSVTTGTGTMANLNTSPPLMLELVHSMTRQTAEKIVRDRKAHIIKSLMEASSRYGVLFQGGQFQTSWQPSGYVRIMLGDRQGRHKRWIGVKFTATSNGAPWIIQYSHPVSFDHRPQEHNTKNAFSPNETTEAAPGADTWPYYSAFFPHQLSME